ncbi:hypothetical protein A2U01_0073820, partial [Trifolium medium]|nr:hypothetical protein [Trifolium medium]
MSLSVSFYSPIFLDPNKYDIEIHNQFVRTGRVELEHTWLTSLVRANHVEVESREGEAR